MERAMEAFAQAHCSPWCQDAFMGAVEGVLEGGPLEAAAQLLQPHAGHIVAGLRNVVQAKQAKRPAKAAAPAEQRMKVRATAPDPPAHAPAWAGLAACHHPQACMPLTVSHAPKLRSACAWHLHSCPLPGAARLHTGMPAAPHQDGALRLTPCACWPC